MATLGTNRENVRLGSLSRASVDEPRIYLNSAHLYSPSDYASTTSSHRNFPLHHTSNNQALDMGNERQSQSPSSGEEQIASGSPSTRARRNASPSHRADMTAASGSLPPSTDYSSYPCSRSTSISSHPLSSPHSRHRTAECQSLASSPSSAPMRHSQTPTKSLESSPDPSHVLLPDPSDPTSLSTDIGLAPGNLHGNVATRQIIDLTDDTSLVPPRFSPTARAFRQLPTHSPVLLDRQLNWHTSSLDSLFESSPDPEPSRRKRNRDEIQEHDEEPEQLLEISSDSEVEQLVSQQIAGAVDSQNQELGTPERRGLANISCVICMETMTSITATHCGHLFCHTCLMEALIAGENQPPGPDQPPYRDGKGPSKCPVCRKRVRRPKTASDMSNVIPLEIMVRPAQSNNRERVGAQHRSDQESPRRNFGSGNSGYQAKQQRRWQSDHQHRRKRVR